MCDYSLHAIESRPAEVGEKLISTSFRCSSTRGFATQDNRGWPSASSLAPNWLSRKTSGSITDGYGPRARAFAWRDFASSTRISPKGTTTHSNFQMGGKYW
jgi:hypothetical protein